MTTREVFKKVNQKSSGRTVEPEDNVMIESIADAMKRVAMDTLPTRLTGTAEDMAGYRVLRKVDADTYVRFPLTPNNPDEELVMDEFLIDAMAYWIIKLLEPQREKAHYRGYMDEIDMNNGRLVETMLSEPDEESTPRNCYFP